MTTLVTMILPYRALLRAPFAWLLIAYRLASINAYTLGSCNSGLHCDDESHAISNDNNATTVNISGFCGSFKTAVGDGYMCINHDCTDCTLFQAVGACVEAGMGKTFRSWCKTKRQLKKRERM